jgi:hypothetical protein
VLGLEPTGFATLDWSTLGHVHNRAHKIWAQVDTDCPELAQMRSGLPGRDFVTQITCESHVPVAVHDFPHAHELDKRRHISGGHRRVRRVPEVRSPEGSLGGHGLVPTKSPRAVTDDDPTLPCRL